MTFPKLRVIAGPNGSGKTTLFEYLQSDFDFRFGFILNPDDLDRRLSEAGMVDLDSWGISTTTSELQISIQNHALGKFDANQLPHVKDGKLVVPSGFKPGYLTIAIADFLRYTWLENGSSFSFETVLSHPAKLQVLERARALGFRTYLYFVCTELPLINIERVMSRVATGGHAVPPEKIEARYHRSLGLLTKAIQASSRSFLFDNSGAAHRFIAELQDGQLMRIQEPLPEWFVTSVLQDMTGGQAGPDT